MPYSSTSGGTCHPRRIALCCALQVRGVPGPRPGHRVEVAVGHCITMSCMCHLCCNDLFAELSCAHSHNRWCCDVRPTIRSLRPKQRSRARSVVTWMHISAVLGFKLNLGRRRFWRRYSVAWQCRGVELPEGFTSARISEKIRSFTGHKTIISSTLVAFRSPNNG
ncbi:hypothetical protein OH77DRAFT_177852 [Trametes cingulata]|nr:hypothetical protein OH77DRAFT_177852 [Trametes cingulata]